MPDPGMKELVRTMQKIEDHLEDISRSLSTIAKIQNRQFPQVTMTSERKMFRNEAEHEEDDEDEMS